MGVDDYGSKLCLQNHLLSNILNQKGMRVDHLGAIKEWLQDQRVLIILDDVDDLEQLEVLAKERFWFGCGSRIIVTTQDKNIFKAHGIEDIYHVDFPSSKDALEMLCLYAFKQSSVPDGFEEVASRVAKLCGYLPLGLSVVGSSLRGESKDEWEVQVSRIESSLDRKIEDVLRVSYDRLVKKDQDLFLHIACIFNICYTVGYVRSMLGDSNLDVENGLKTLAVKSLVKINAHPDSNYSDQSIVMHSLLEQMGRQVVHQQSDEPGKRKFLVDAKEIRDVLGNKTGTGSVIGISLDMSKVGDFSISGRAFEGMPNLRFLKIYASPLQLQMSEDMEYLPRLRLLDWHSYSRKRLPPNFQPECLIELNMKESNLEKLWDGIQPLPNLKTINLAYSQKLESIPNLSKATNLETLSLGGCTSLVELPSSIRNLYKLKRLCMGTCVKLRVIPTNINLASLQHVNMSHCSSLRIFPDISRNIELLNVRDTKIEDVPASIVGRLSRCRWLTIGSKSLKRLTHVPEGVTRLDLSHSDIKKIPDCVIRLPVLTCLILQNCRKLVSLQSLPPSLLDLDATDCGSLRSVCFLFYETKTCITLNDCKCVKSENDAIRVSSFFYDPSIKVSFLNCFSLSEEARRVVIQGWGFKNVLLPGKEVPAEFTHKAKGNSVTISSGIFSASSRYKACLLLLPVKTARLNLRIHCHVRSKGVLINNLNYSSDIVPFDDLLTEHLLVFSGALFKEHICVEVDAAKNEIQFEFICKNYGVENVDDMIIECGVQMLADEGEIRVSSSFDYPNRRVRFLNCLLLDEEARRVIIQRWACDSVLLPGKQVPAEFIHKAKGNSITLSSGTFSSSSRFKACLLLSPNIKVELDYVIVCRLRSKGVLINELRFWETQCPQLLTEHLFVFPGPLFEEQRCLEEDATTSEIQFEFICEEIDDMIIECGVQMLADEGESSSKEQSDGAAEVSKDSSVVKRSRHTCW
ncbi:unnamed protein product [Microthlaspi erraticum]|uniref:Uncharacterized protein n=1 Tax=Microthlaspi erraticum TaxID=1685480 RepID=A0A6D2K6X1_9BRAS|nr:unnamed protein product [Microthlaspi erraticum]